MENDNFYNASNLMPGVPQETMTVRNVKDTQESSPQGSQAIESFIKQTSESDNKIQHLTVTFTVVPRHEELKGIKLMEAVLLACGEVDADITTFSIRKDEKK